MEQLQVNSMLEVKGLTKVFSERRNNPVVAVNNITFTCLSGTIVGLVGPNGAGKTTAMRTIATILSPTSGTASVDGFDIRSDARMVRSRMGFLTGETGLYDRLTAYEILSYFGKLHGMGETAINSRIKVLAEVFGIGDFLNMRVQKMSSGMRQKVSLARTMIHDPPMLILDEPTTGLDVITLKHVVSFILRNKAEGKCILFSSHMMSEVEAVCDEVIFMHKGSIIAKGTRERLLAAYKKTTLEEVFLYLIRGNGGIL